MLSNRLEQLKTQFMISRPEVFHERAVLVTQAYKEAANSSTVARRALAMDKIFRNVSITVRDGELIVGSKTLARQGSPLYPEFNSEWIEKEIDTLSKRTETAFYVSDETRKEIKNNVLPFWPGKTVYDRILEYAPKAALDGQGEGMFFHYYLNRSIGHITVDYEKILRIGLKGVKEDIKSALERLGSGEPDCEQKSEYYGALLLTADAIIVFANRHADEAESLANCCSDATRKKELESIAANCRRVPEYPAESYNEALQSFWFVHLALNLESNSYAISPGRFCQYIYPYYKKDLDKGALTREWGQELLNCLWLKFAELTVVKESGTAKASNTYADFQNLNVGGLKPDGSDGTNDISYMCIEAQMSLLLAQPQLSCLISSKTPYEFLLKACELARMGTGMPAMFNADEIVLALVEKGKSLVDARKGGINGCVEITAQGCDNMASSGYVNLVMCLMLALNDGKNVMTDTQCGPHTGNPNSFKTIEDLWVAFEKQIHRMVEIKQLYDNAARKAFGEICPALVTSLVIDDCIEKGLDFHQGGASYNQPMMCGVGTGTVADSIACIEKHVFKDKVVSLNDLLDALQANFKGHEKMRDLFWNNSPKFGNNN